MSIIWFLFLAWVYQQGVEISEIVFMMISIFYIGDCVLLKNMNVRISKN